MEIITNFYTALPYYYPENRGLWSVYTNFPLYRTAAFGELQTTANHGRRMLQRVPSNAD
jgi:hypothetical protein